MSTDLHDRAREPSPDDGPDRPRPPKTSLSVAQVVGGALAAMTAAALGSRLSVAGTVVGAALASVIAAVGGAIYTASLRRTSKHISAVVTRVRPTGSATTSAQGPDATTVGSAPLDAEADPAPGWTLPVGPADRTAGATTVPARRSRIGWRSVLVAALLMFLVAALALTGLELATGRALSGGTGTTVGQVADPATRPTAAPTKRATPTSSATPSASASASAEPRATSTPTASSEPTAEPSASSSPAPSSTPTDEATPTAPATPTASGLASPAATPTS